MKNDKSWIGLVIVAVMIGAGLFGLDSRMTRANNITINVTVTPDAREYSQPSTLQSVSAALPSLNDFLKSNQPVAQAADAPQAAPSTVTGWLDPSLGKVVIVDGVSRKFKCEGLEQNADFVGLSESQKMLVKDTCSQL